MLIVEPHADDAFLSMGGLIERFRDKIHFIMTVYSGTRKRGEDAKRYADAVGVPWIGLGFEESGGFMDKPAALVDEAKVAEQIAGYFDPIVLPLGIGQHPEHLYIRELFEKSGNKKFYYVDQPYASKLKWQDDLLLRTINKKVIWCMRPGARKFRHIPLFKDQAKFFYFNNETELYEKTFELVVE